MNVKTPEQLVIDTANEYLKKNLNLITKLGYLQELNLEGKNTLITNLNDALYLLLEVSQELGDDFFVDEEKDRTDADFLMKIGDKYIKVYMDNNGLYSHVSYGQKAIECKVVIK